MQVLFALLGGVALAAGIVGSVLPIIPGPPLVFFSIILISIGYGWETFSLAFLITMGVIAVGVTVTDFLLPNVVAKKRGASRAGTLGSLAGMLAGMALIPPFGLFVGAFAGAVAGELLFGKVRKNALKAGWGVFLGSFLSMTLKLCYAGITGYFYMRTLLS